MCLHFPEQIQKTERMSRESSILGNFSFKSVKINTLQNLFP